MVAPRGHGQDDAKWPWTGSRIADRTLFVNVVFLLLYAVSFASRLKSPSSILFGATGHSATFFPGHGGVADAEQISAPRQLTTRITSPVKPVVWPVVAFHG